MTSPNSRILFVTWKYNINNVGVDYINENYKLELSESDEYETLGGLIMNETGEIPEQDSEIKIDNFLFLVFARFSNL